MTTAEKLNQAIGGALYKCRESMKMTRGEFSSFLGVSYRSYSNYEDGFQQPKLNTLLAICNKLEISLSNMLGRKA